MPNLPVGRQVRKQFIPTYRGCQLEPLVSPIPVIIEHKCYSTLVNSPPCFNKHLPQGKPTPGGTQTIILSGLGI